MREKKFFLIIEKIGKKSSPKILQKMYSYGTQKNENSFPYSHTQSQFRRKCGNFGHRKQGPPTHTNEIQCERKRENNIVVVEEDHTGHGRGRRVLFHSSCNNMHTLSKN